MTVWWHGRKLLDECWVWLAALSRGPLIDEVQTMWVQEIWRYPVKSMPGESLRAADLTEAGVVPLPLFGETHRGDDLGRERLSKQGGKPRRYWIVCIVQCRKALQDSLAQFAGEHAEAIVDRVWNRHGLPFVRWDSKKLVAPWFSIAARDAMDGVGGLFDKAKFGGEQAAPPAINTHFRG